jgi:peptide/nickel transport system permease protein
VQRQIATRVLATVPVIFGIVLMAFILMRLVPGDVVDAMLAESSQDPEVAAELRRVFGLDRPAPVQLLDYLGGLVRGDLGTSLRTGRPVLEEIGARFPATLELALAALLVSLIIAIPSGVISATQRNRLPDYLARAVSLIGLSVPNFWLGILLITLFAVQLRLLPSGGFAAFSDPGQNLKLLLMPAVTLGASIAAVTMRMTRSSLLEVLEHEYVRTARSKGLKERAVVYGHALRNALIPVVTILGIQAGRLLGGTVVIEQVFGWPGIGSLVVRAISQRDYPLIQGSVVFLALLFVLINLIVDILYLYLDPRLRRG